MIFKLMKIDLSRLGAHGADTPILWEKYFHHSSNAMKAADQDHGSQIRWNSNSKGWSSPDLGHCQYRIWSIKLEDKL